MHETRVLNWFSVGYKNTRLGCMCRCNYWMQAHLSRVSAHSKRSYESESKGSSLVLRVAFYSIESRSWPSQRVPNCQLFTPGANIQISVALCPMEATTA